MSKRWLADGILSVFAVIALALLLFGCGVTAGQVVTGAGITGTVLAGCEPGEQSAVEDAIRNGGASWISVVLDGLGCIWDVYKGLKGSGLVADNGSTMPLSHRAQHRLATALKLRQLIVK
jgi:hypothetical protein